MSSGVRRFEYVGRWLLVIAVVLAAGDVEAQTASISSVSVRPFVTGLIPVIGRNGAIGGVMVNAAGVVRRAEVSDSASLRDGWLRSRKPLSAELGRETKMRMVSLRGLEAAIARHLKDKTPLPDDVFFLAGMHRVQYVFLVPERKDVILAGPADGWRLGDEAAMVTETSRTPVLRLDDLMDALRAAKESVVTCSIDPTEEGLLRLKQLLSRRQVPVGDEFLEGMRTALGPQRISITGVSPDSHFARVMVAADYQMKLLAMGLHPAPLDDFPSYLTLLSRSSRRGQEIAAPRWWLATDYDPMLRSPDGLAWQLRGPGVKALTEDGSLGESGEIIETGRPNPLAERWARSMSERYTELGASMSAFAALRNCMDLAVVAALVFNEDMLARAECALPLLLRAARIRGPRYNTPKTVDSQVSLSRGSRGWFVSISGGVEIDAWEPLKKVRSSRKLVSVRRDALDEATENWWWD